MPKTPEEEVLEIRPTDTLSEMGVKLGIRHAMASEKKKAAKKAAQGADTQIVGGGLDLLGAEDPPVRRR